MDMWPEEASSTALPASGHTTFTLSLVLHVTLNEQQKSTHWIVNLQTLLASQWIYSKPS